MEQAFTTIKTLHKKSGWQPPLGVLFGTDKNYHCFCWNIPTKKWHCSTCKWWLNTYVVSNDPQKIVLFEIQQAYIHLFAVCNYEKPLFGSNIPR